MKVTGSSKGFELSIKVQGFEHDKQQKTIVERRGASVSGSGNDDMTTTTEDKVLGPSKQILNIELETKCEEETHSAEFDKEDYERMMAQAEKINEVTVEKFLAPMATKLIDLLSTIGMTALANGKQSREYSHKETMADIQARSK